jgi:hypothetical protein
MKRLPTFIFLILIFLFCFEAGACGDNLSSSLPRPNRETLGPGAKLILRSEEVFASPAADLNQARVAIRPGQEITTLTGYYKRHGRIPVVSVEVEGFDGPLQIFWNDLYRKAVVLQPGRAPTPKVKKAGRLKFPDKMHQAQFAAWAEEGRTWYGRPFAKKGQWVWVANHSRSMSIHNVGKVDSIEVRLSPGNWSQRGWATVKTLSGETKTVYHYDCNPVSQDEVALVRATIK